MKIIVLHGSPKGKHLSLTLQHVLYFEKIFPEQELIIHHIARKITKLENDPTYFNTIIRDIEESDGIIWATPIYDYLVPAQYKRFIELIFERKKEHVFAKKYATSILTSAKIYDYAAENYLHAISEDLGMSFIKGYSAEAIYDKDLLKKKNQRFFRQFGESFLSAVRDKKAVPIRFAPLPAPSTVSYTHQIRAHEHKTNEKRIVVVTDYTKNTNLEYMVQNFVNGLEYEVTVINLNDHRIYGCTGCVKCVIYDACAIKDDFKALYFDTILKADAVIIAATINDRFLSSKMKTYIDREIVIGWRPLFKDKRIGYLLSGRLRGNENLYHILHIMSGAKDMELIGIITDEYNDSDFITRLIKNFCADLTMSLKKNFRGPVNFFRRTSHLHIRELLSLITSIHLFDYKYYKKHKLFDYPYKSFTKVMKGLGYNILFTLPIISTIVKKSGIKIIHNAYEKMLKSDSSTIQ